MSRQRMRRRHSLRFRLAAVFAVTFVVGAAALTAAGYAIVAHTFPQPLQADQLLGIPAATTIAASTDTEGAPTTDSGAPSAGTEARTPTDADAADGAPSSAATVSTAAVPIEAVPTVQTAQARQRETGLRDALLLSIAALVAVTGLAIVAGWQVAGRALAPIRKITATAHEISADRLDDRIALAGPHDELRELGETFDGMLDRLETSFAAQGRFVASASHELQTPLTLVRAEADVALEDPDATRAELREALEQVRASAERGGGVVGALLVLARSGSALETTEEVDLGEIVTAAVAAVRPRADAANVVVVATAAGSRPVVVRGDRALLTALVDNLLANAVIYNRDGGDVTVTTTTGADAATLGVRNTGPVVPIVDIDGLFTPFARGETSRARRTGGAGLGLAIVRTVAEAHDGTATATAGPDGGLDVRVRLRRA